MEFNSSGRSSIPMCPVPGNTTSSAWGMPSAMAMACLGGVSTSRVPTTTRVGRSVVPRRSLSLNEPMPRTRDPREAGDIAARIAVRALRRIFLHVAVSGVDLQDVVHHHIQHLRRPHLEDGALHRILLR